MKKFGEDFDGHFCVLSSTLKVNDINVLPIKSILIYFSIVAKHLYLCHCDGSLGLSAKEFEVKVKNSVHNFLHEIYLFLLCL